jgi:hypothetical protein
MPLSAVALSKVRLTAMKIAAGMPFPETSPMTTPRCVGGQEKCEVPADFLRRKHRGVNP